MRSPMNSMLWLLLGLSTGLLVAVVLFEHQQASRDPVVYGGAEPSQSDAALPQREHRVVTSGTAADSTY